MQVRSQLNHVAPGKPQTILVLGADRRKIDVQQHNPTRSDTMILVRLDPKRGGDGDDVAPARPARRRSPATARQDQRGVLASAGRADAADDHARCSGIKIHHVVNVNFWGFREAVDRLGCVYVDVDRTLLPLQPPACRRRRHVRRDRRPGPATRSCAASGRSTTSASATLDSDLVRAARQQDFLRPGQGPDRRQRRLRRPREAAATSSPARCAPTSAARTRSSAC